VEDQWLTPVILATQKAEIRRIVVWSQPRQIPNTYKEKRWKRGGGGGVAQLVKCLPCKSETLSSNSSTRRKKDRDGGREDLIFKSHAIVFWRKILR
jgi:hypothetical protein